MRKFHLSKKWGGQGPPGPPVAATAENIRGERKQIIFQNGICRFWEELFIYWQFSRKATPTEINKVSYERHREAEASVQPQMV